MAGGFSSKWTTMGSNTDSTVDSGTSGGGDDGIGTLTTGVSNASNGGTSNEVRHECTVWLVDNGETYTPNFDWAINTDFTVVLNATRVTLDSDPGNVDFVVQGSVDGTNFVDMQDLGDWDAGTATVGQGLYDFDANGRMPYMRLNLDCGNNVDNGEKPIKVCIFMHNT